MSEAPRAKPGRSRLRSVLGLALAAVGLWFGFAVLNLTDRAGELSSGEKALRIVFGIVWFAFWIGAIVYNALNYRSAPRSKKTG